VILNQIFKDMQDNIHLVYPNIYMNNYLRQQESEIKLINNDHLTFEFDGTWFRDPKNIKFNTKEINLPRYHKYGKDL
jgi:hypothetical protein